MAGPTIIRGLFSDLIDGKKAGLRRLKTVLDPLRSIGFVSPAGAKQAIKEQSYLAGAPSASTTNTMKATLENKAGSGKVLVVSSVVAAHDQGSTIVDLVILRNPTIDLPATTREPINFSLRGVSTPVSQAVFKSDTGTAMSGASETVTIPTQGNSPNAFSIDTPVIIYPGEIVGINYRVGGALSSAIAGLSVLWAEVNEAEIEAVRLS